MYGHAVVIRVGLLAAVVLVFTSCSSTKDPTTAAATSSIAATTTSAAAATTSIAAPAATIPPTVPSPSLTAEVLRPGGVGAMAFGESGAVVADGLAAIIGAASSDQTTQFPNVVDAVHETADGSAGFALAVGRTVCWSELCVYLGGTTPSSLTFVGWQYRASGSATPALRLATAAGITIGSRWADFPEDLTVQPGGCPTSGAGSTSDGIVAAVHGGVFSRIDENGAYQEMLPDPADVSVSGLSAGFVVFPLESDC